MKTDKYVEIMKIQLEREVLHKEMEAIDKILDTQDSKQIMLTMVKALATHRAIIDMYQEEKIKRLQEEN